MKINRKLNDVFKGNLVVYNNSNYYTNKLEELKVENNSIVPFVEEDSQKDLFFEISLRLGKIKEVLREIESINDKGFVNSFDLSNSSKYPNFSKLIKVFVNEIDLLKSKELIQLTKWCYNIMLLDIYKELKDLISFISLNNNTYDNEDLKDKMLDFSVNLKDVFNKIDPSIRVHLRKSGVSFMLNTYTGFDTEYQNIDSKYNELLSVQLAVSSRIIVKLPLTFSKYSFNKVNTLKGTVYGIEVKSKLIDYDLIEENLTNRIKSIKSAYYKEYDESIDNIINGLKELKIPFCLKHDTVYFMFEKSKLKTWFFSGITKEGIGLEDLLKKSNDMSSRYLEEGLENIYNLFKDIFNKSSASFNNNPIVLEEVEDHEDSEEMEENKAFEKRDIKESKKFSRTNKHSFSKEKVVVTIVRNNYFIGHLTSADLSILNDFEKYKTEFDIVNGCFVTLKRALLLDNVNLILRDSKLLAPGGQKSLKAIGSLYGEEFYKKDIGDNIHNMKNFLEKDYESFKDYAIQDAVICLIHALFMEEFVFKMGVIGIPLTLSSISKAYVENKWALDKYKGYQISGEYLIGETSKTQTPKGLFSVGSIGLYTSFYIANYKGGRNESFMYGIDKTKKWFDYDLISAYTTGMALLGDPDYQNGRKITVKELEWMKAEDIILSYIIIKTYFKFPEDVKYPSIPCFVDKDTTVYPLTGEAVLTGSEYLLAKEQGCELTISDIYYLPFKQPQEVSKGVIKEPYKPFFSTIKELQASRAEHKAGTINNLIYKEMGNSLYGLVVKGISNKLKFDTRLKTTVRMEAGILSNPVLASWITGFIRSVLGELLHNTHKLKGSVVSVTTDGFITDVEDLEAKILKMSEDKQNLLKMYKESRIKLSNVSTALEIKKQGSSIFSWTTRGQFSLDSKIMAATGFQRNFYTLKEIEELFENTLNSKDKEIVYINHRLRSALDIFKSGGHVTSVYKDQIFRMVFDNRRRIVLENVDLGDDLADKIKLLDSQPVKDKNEAELFRYLGKIPKSSIYQKNTSQGDSYKSTYINKTDVAIRNFIRGLLNGEFNLDSNYFKNYSELSRFINNYKNYLENLNEEERTKYKFQLIKPNIIAQLKRRPVIPKVLIRNESIEKFLDYVKETFPEFDSEKFYNRFKK